MEKPIVSQQNQGIQRIKTILLSDFWIKILLLVALLGCLYTILTVKQYQEAINTYWIETFKRSCTGYTETSPPNFEYNFFDKNQNGKLILNNSGG